jgi:hypothetical protein
LFSRVNSTNEPYIKSKIKEVMHGTSVTCVLIGKETCDSKWVQWELEQSLKKDNPNGILAIRLDDANLPEGCPVHQALEDAGAEIMDWDSHSLGAAIERAALAAGRARAIRCAGSGGGTCSR